MKKNNIHSQQDTVQTEHLSRRHFYIIIVLIVIILVALVAHTILRPDRNATLRIIYTSDMQGQITYSDGQTPVTKKLLPSAISCPPKVIMSCFLMQATVLETVLSLKWTMASPFFL